MEDINYTTAGSIFGIEHAPVFYPSEEEFKDPWKYLSSIEPYIVSRGMCVIQPPLNGQWDFQSSEKYLKPKKFSFITKAQNVHQMQKRNGPNLSFLMTLKKYWKNSGGGVSLSVLPEINGVVVDLYRLHNEVINRGGLLEVDQKRLWAEVAQLLKLYNPAEDDDSVLTELRDNFVKYLLPYIKDKEANIKEETVKEEIVKEETVKEETVKEETVKEETVKEETQNNNNEKSKRELPQSSLSTNKRRKLDEPIWSQVRSRSFTIDAEECKKNKTINISDEDSGESDEQGDFGYEMGGDYTLEQYKEMAEEFEERWSHANTIYQKESEYWRIIESGEEYVQVQYGSDLDVANHGSGFPMNKNSTEPSVQKRAQMQRKTCSKTSEYMLKSGWNTNNLAEHTFLHHLNESVAGLTRPMLYVGMLFSSFCWHTEDNYLFSVNYIHKGKAKRWYSVPSSKAALFEHTMRQYHPELFKQNPNLLHLLVTQLSPKILAQAGVPVFTAVQKPGQFIVTCPRSYHAGFNTGFNIAESVNFALESWLPFCALACNEYRFQRVAAFPYEEFVLQASKKPDSDIIAKRLQNEIRIIIHNEQQLQWKIIKEVGITRYLLVQNTPYRPCSVCGYDCFISGITCYQHTDKISCLHHIASLCECGVEHKVLLIRVHLMELYNIANSLERPGDIVV